MDFELIRLISGLAALLAVNAWVCQDEKNLSLNEIGHHNGVSDSQVVWIDKRVMSSEYRRGIEEWGGSSYLNQLKCLLEAFLFSLKWYFLLKCFQKVA